MTDLLLPIIRTADAIIALPGKYGTLTEMAFGLLSGKPIVSLSARKLDDSIFEAESPEEAARKAMELAGVR